MTHHKQCHNTYQVDITCPGGLSHAVVCSLHEHLLQFLAARASDECTIFYKHNNNIIDCVHSLT